MGAAKITRSQSRKTRLNCNSDVSEKALSSPFVVLPGNNVDSTLRRRTRRETGDLNFVEKENAPPCTSRWTEGGRLERKGLQESSKKVVKKRKQSEQVSKGSGKCTATTAVKADLQTPVTFQHELSSHRPDVQVAENRARSHLCPQIELLSDRELPLVERAGGPSENQTGLQSRCLNVDNSATKAATGSMGHRTATVMGDQRKGVGSRQISNDADAGTVLPSLTALVLLQKDYERLFSRYKKLKAQRLDEVDALYNEQNSRISDFVQATETLLEFYKGENLSLKQQISVASSSELSERCKRLERTNVECRNGLLLEQAKGLELRQENKKLKALLLEHIADKQRHSETEPVQGSQMGNSTDTNREVKNDSTSNAKLVHGLLECVLGLQLSCSDGGFEPHLHFHHRSTGFSFDIKEAHDKEIAELVEGGELMYQNVSVGVCRKAVDWMKEKELIFGMNQAQMLFKRVIGYLNRGLC